MNHVSLIRPRVVLAVWAVIVLVPGPVSTAEMGLAAYPLPERFAEAPILEARVAAGTLPPVERRLPEEPLVLGPGDGYGFESTGRYGGMIRLDADGPTGLQAHVDAGPMYFDGRRVLPLVWKSCSPDGDKRVWTVRLRRGMKWSDGHPYTVDDVLFWYEAVGLNRELTPLPESWMLEDGEPFRLEKVDDIMPMICGTRWWATPSG